MAFTWIDKPFEKLSNLELYNIIKLRQEVFIVEQDCVYLDNDGNLLKKSGQNTLSRFFVPGLGNHFGYKRWLF